MFCKHLKVLAKILMLFFNLGHCFCLDTLIKRASYLRHDFILLNILCAKNLVHVLDELHGDNLMGQLIVVFVDELAEPEVEFKRVTVFGGDKTTVWDGDVGDSVELVFK